MGYAKALLLDADRNNQSATIIDAPGHLAGRKALLIGQYALGLTWQYSTGKDVFQRTDYFFETPAGLLVASIVAPAEIQEAIRAQAEEVLKRGMIVEMR